MVMVGVKMDNFFLLHESIDLVAVPRRSRALGLLQYGVMHAANEFLVRYGEDWEVAYYTFGPTDSGGDLGLRRLR